MLTYAMLIAFAFLPNGSGGEIVLTTDITEDCGENMHFAYSTSPIADTIPGCWFHDERMVHIKWLPDGSIRSYPISNFQKIQGV